MLQGRGEDTHNRCPTPYLVSSWSTTWTKGIKDRETSPVDLNKYTTMKHISGDQVKGVDGQSRPKNPRMNALTRLPSTKTNKNAKGDPSWCYSSHQMDQHVLDIQRNVLFLQIIHPDRGVPRHKAAGGSHESLDAANPFQRTI